MFRQEVHAHVIIEDKCEREERREMAGGRTSMGVYEITGQGHGR